jgi:hypothetical protein
VGLTAQVSRETNVERNILPSTAAEDFARFLEEKPKTYYLGPEPYRREHHSARTTISMMRCCRQG